MAAFSVVVPAYREEHRIGATLETLVEFVEGRDAEIIVVDDGSDDATSDVALKSLASFPCSQVLRLERNRGKGAAVQAGAFAARGETIVFMDADLASDLGDLEPLLRALDDADIAIASRTHAASVTLGGTRIRAVMAQCFNAMVRVLVGMHFDDTQCGFKAFRRQAADRIFPLLKSNRFAFDVEVLAIADRLDLTVTEIPLTWTAVPGTRVRLIDPLQMTLDLVRIRARWHRSALGEADRQSARHRMGGRQLIGGRGRQLIRGSSAGLVSVESGESRPSW